MNKSSFTAILEKEGDLYVALCPELDVASQGNWRSRRWSCSSSVPIPPRSRRAGMEKCSSPASKRSMGKLRPLSGRQICRILQQHGFVEVRRRGSHIVMQRHRTLFET